MLLGTTCSLCGAAGPPLCPRCWRAVRRAGAHPPPPGLDACWSLLRYDGGARRLVVGLKYRNARAVLSRLGAAVGQLVVAELADGTAALPPIDVVAWAPTSPARARARGYDQAELLARAVARTVHRPCRPVLVRHEGPPQTGAGREQRLVGPRFAARRPIEGAILVVDDVLTTGATLREAAHALRDSGATHVYGATAARTPDHGPMAPQSVRPATVGGRMAQLRRPAS